MSHLKTLLMNEVRKPLEELERNHVGYIHSETGDRIYYKIDNRCFSIEFKEIDNMGKEVKSED